MLAPCSEWTQDTVNQYQQRVEEQAHALAKQYTNDLTAQNVVHEALILPGDARKVIVRECERIKPAALVIGSRGMGTIKRSLLGSVSDHCLHACDCPVIVVRE